MLSNICQDVLMKIGTFLSIDDIRNFQLVASEFNRCVLRSQEKSNRFFHQYPEIPENQGRCPQRFRMFENKVMLCQDNLISFDTESLECKVVPMNIRKDIVAFNSKELLIIIGSYEKFQLYSWDFFKLNYEFKNSCPLVRRVRQATNCSQGFYMNDESIFVIFGQRYVGICLEKYSFAGECLQSANWRISEYWKWIPLQPGNRYLGLSFEDDVWLIEAQNLKRISVKSYPGLIAFSIIRNDYLITMQMNMKFYLWSIESGKLIQENKFSIMPTIPPRDGLLMIQYNTLYFYPFIWKNYKQKKTPVYIPCQFGSLNISEVKTK